MEAVLPLLLDHLTIAEVYRLWIALGCADTDPLVARCLAQRMGLKKKATDLRQLTPHMHIRCLACGTKTTRWIRGGLMVCGPCGDGDGSVALRSREYARELHRRRVRQGRRMPRFEERLVKMAPVAYTTTMGRGYLYWKRDLDRQFA